MDLVSWNPNGQGNNIRHLFTDIERTIWDKAFPYQDIRNDLGHIEHVTYFAFELLKYIKAERSVVIPAAIFHDTGWGEVIGEGKILPSYEPLSEDFKRNEPRYRHLHQIAGEKISKRILNEVEYQPKFIPTILEIVSQHDTRDDFFCSEDGVVRDADKLWRFTLRHWEIYFKDEFTSEEISKIFNRDIEKPGFFYSDISRHIARVEAEQTMRNTR